MPRFQLSHTEADRVLRERLKTETKAVSIAEVYRRALEAYADQVDEADELQEVADYLQIHGKLGLASSVRDMIRGRGAKPGPIHLVAERIVARRKVAP